MKKKIQNFCFTPSQSNLKYAPENRPWVGGLKAELELGTLLGRTTWRQSSKTLEDSRLLLYSRFAMFLRGKQKDTERFGVQNKNWETGL